MFASFLTHFPRPYEVHSKLLSSRHKEQREKEAQNPFRAARLALSADVGVDNRPNDLF